MYTLIMPVFNSKFPYPLNFSPFGFYLPNPAFAAKASRWAAKSKIGFDWQGSFWG